MNKTDSNSELNRWVELLRQPDPAQVVNDELRFSRGGLTAGSGARLLAVLQRQKRFSEMVALGELLVLRGERDYEFLRRLSQALIEEGRLGLAALLLDSTRARLESRLAELSDDESAGSPRERLTARREQTELQGLLGRTYKQHYINGNPSPERPLTHEAEQASRFYREAYEAAPVENLWHGINYVAIHSHQHRLLQQGKDVEAERVAKEILQNVKFLEEQGVTEVWDYATWGEALIALGRLKEALVPFGKYCSHPSIDSFMRASTHRQMVQLWQLDRDPQGRKILDLLTQAPPAKAKPEPSSEDRLESVFAGEPAGDSTSPETGESDTQLESRFADPAFKAFTFDEQAKKRAVGVARLGRDFYSGAGTGFLFDGKLIWPEYKGPPLMMTNAHVCSNLQTELNNKPPSLPPEQVTVIFIHEVNSRPAKVLVEYVEVLWSSPREELDATILMLLAAPTTEPYPPSKELPKLESRAFLIGHPLGGGKFFSSDKNIIKELEAEGKYFYYTSATEPGNSGSPVFNEQWELIGLHRASSKSKKLNYGVLMGKILEKARGELADKFGASGPSL